MAGVGVILDSENRILKKACFSSSMDPDNSKDPGEVEKVCHGFQDLKSIVFSMIHSPPISIFPVRVIFPFWSLAVRIELGR